MISLGVPPRIRSFTTFQHKKPPRNKKHYKPSQVDFFHFISSRLLASRYIYITKIRIREIVCRCFVPNVFYSNCNKNTKWLTNTDMTQLRTGLERMCRLFCPEQVAFHARQDLVNFHSHLWTRIQASLRLAQDKQNLRYFSRRQTGIHVFSSQCERNFCYCHSNIFRCSNQVKCQHALFQS